MRNDVWFRKCLLPCINPNALLRILAVCCCIISVLSTAAVTIDAFALANLVDYGFWRVDCSERYLSTLMQPIYVLIQEVAATSRWLCLMSERDINTGGQCFKTQWEDILSGGIYHRDDIPKLTDLLSTIVKPIVIRYTWLQNRSSAVNIAFSL